jgi:hypothetical protein
MFFSHKKTVSGLVELVNANPTTQPKETVNMKCSKAAVHRKTGMSLMPYSPHQ